MTSYFLRSPRRDEPDIIVTIIGMAPGAVVRMAGAHPVRLTFDSAREAQAHVERFVREHQQQGFTAIESRMFQGDVVVDVPEELTIKAAREGMRVELFRVPVLPSDQGEASPTLSANVLETISAQTRERKPQRLEVAVSCYPGRLPGPQFAATLDPSIATFIFDSGDYPSRQCENSLGDVSGVLAACPMLKRAHFMGCSAMTPTRHEHIEELRLLGDRLDPSLIPALGASEFPALETLAIAQEYDIPVAELAHSLRTIKAPRLSDLYVGVAPSVLEFLDAIGPAELPWNLTVWDEGFDDIDGLMALLDRNEALRAGRLFVDFGDILMEDEIPQLAARGVAIAGNTFQRFNHWYW